MSKDAEGKVFLCGVEGGGTHTTAVIMNGEGKEVARVVGGASNQWLLGLSEALDELVHIVQRAKKAAKIPDLPLTGLGLSLSGVDSEGEKEEVMKGMAERDSNLASSYLVCNDSISAIYTSFDRGGIACVSGTGSICSYASPEANFVRVGGYGHLLGDEGGAFYIAQSALKKMLRLRDGQSVHDFEKEDADAVWNSAQIFFKIDDIRGLLAIVYRQFDKALIASFAVEVAKLAAAGNALCSHIMEKAGMHLANQVRALISSLPSVGWKVNVVCVGNVFNSWALLEPKFLETFLDGDMFGIKELRIYRLIDTSAIGALFLAGREKGIDLSFDRSKMIVSLYSISLR